MGYFERKTQQEEYEMVMHSLYSLWTEYRNDSNFKSYVEIQDENKLLENGFRNFIKGLVQ